MVPQGSAAKVSRVAACAWVGLCLAGCDSATPIDPIAACRHVREAVCARASLCRHEAPGWTATCLASAQARFGSCEEDVKSQGCIQTDGFELDRCAVRAADATCAFFTAKTAYAFQYPLCVVHCPDGS